MATCSDATGASPVMAGLATATAVPANWAAFEDSILATDPVVDVIICIAYDGGGFSG